MMDLPRITCYEYMTTVRYEIKAHYWTYMAINELDCVFESWFIPHLRFMSQKESKIMITCANNDFINIILET